MPRESGVAQTVSALVVAFSDAEVKMPTSTCAVVVLGALLKVCAAVEGRKSPKLSAYEPETAVPLRKPAIAEIESFVLIVPLLLTVKSKPM